MNVVELFCGSSTFSNYFKERGHNVFSVDIRKRKGVCEPDLRKDVLDLKIEDIPFDRVDVLWASIPCDVWSYASGDFHWNEDGTPKTDKCKLHIKLLEYSLQFIELLSPGYFFIENPRGKMRFNKCMLDFLKRNGGVEKTITLSSYGFSTTKPTNIFTNALDWKNKELDSFGRGAKVPGTFSNLTKCQRQKTPRALVEEIYFYLESKAHVGKWPGHISSDKVPRGTFTARHICTKCKKKRKEKFLRVVRPSDKPGSRVWICKDACSDGRMNHDALSFLQKGLSSRSTGQSDVNCSLSFPDPEKTLGSLVKSDVSKEKFILDVCCGHKMFWFNKNHPNTIYADVKSDVATKDSNVFQDFRNIQYKDKSFKLVVFDPPHLFRKDGEYSWLNEKYGTLHQEQWPMDIRKGFDECMRVLDDFGILIFKWSAGDISVSTVLGIIEREPLFGHTSDKNNRTHWMCFMKIPEKDKLREIK